MRVFKALLTNIHRALEGTPALSLGVIESEAGQRRTEGEPVDTS